MRLLRARVGPGLVYAVVLVEVVIALVVAL